MLPANWGSAQWIDTQSKAMAAESISRHKTTNALARNDCHAWVSSSSEQDALVLDIESVVANDQWNLEVGTEVQVWDNMYFAKPSAPADGDDLSDEDDTTRVWTGKVLNVGKNWATVEMEATYEECQRSDGLESLSLSLIVIVNDVMDERLHAAIHNTNLALRHEHGELTIRRASAVVNTVLRVKMAPLLLGHHDVRISETNRNPIPLRSGAANLIVDPRLGLD